MLWRTLWRSFLSHGVDRPQKRWRRRQNGSRVWRRNRGSIKKWSRHDAGAAATRHEKPAATDNLTVSTTGRISVDTVTRITAPIGPPDKVEFMTRYVYDIAVRGGMIVLLLYPLISPPSPPPLGPLSFGPFTKNLSCALLFFVLFVFFLCSFAPFVCLLPVRPRLASLFLCIHTL